MIFENLAILMGNCATETKLVELPNEGWVVEFKLGNNRKFTRSDGTEGEETNFIDIKLYGAQAKAVHEYLDVGRPCYIRGRISTERWRVKGSNKFASRTFVKAYKLEFIGERRRRNEAWANDDTPPVEIDIDDIPDA